MTKILLINERGPDFWNAHTVAQDSSYALIENEKEKQITYAEFEAELQTLKGKRILFLIHGLKNTREDVLLNYLTTHNHVKNLSSNLNQGFFYRIRKYLSSILGFWKPEDRLIYDAVIGMSWPSHSHQVYYFRAKDNARQLAPKLASHLIKIVQVVSQLDIVAHSLGNFLLFEALKQSTVQNLKVHHIFSLAAAVSKESLNPGNEYAEVASKCERLYIFYSQNDSALSWPYYLAENRSHALGAYGTSGIKNLPRNIININCSDLIEGHSGYLFSPALYSFLHHTHHDHHDLDSQHEYYILNSSGELTSPANK